MREKRGFAAPLGCAMTSGKGPGGGGGCRDPLDGLVGEMVNSQSSEGQLKPQKGIEPNSPIALGP